jgi:all-trans-retinol dehydrogenase (NAD+)
MHIKIPDHYIIGSIVLSLPLYFLYKTYVEDTRSSTWFRGKRILITGGAGGLGVELTKRLTKLGANVILWDISETRLNEITQQYKVRGYVVNLADQHNVENAIIETLKEGGIDVLINNAGMVIGKPLLECDNKLIGDLMTVNTTSHLWTTKGFLPHMLKKGDGHVVTIASTMALFSATQMITYCASKAGAFMFGEGLRLELDGTGVETSTIMPWHINTVMFKGLNFPWITRLLAPTLDVNYVANQTIHAILNKKKIVLMPKIFWFIFIMRFILPTWLFDMIAKRTGAHTAMKTFDGRCVVPAKEN